MRNRESRRGKREPDPPRQSEREKAQPYASEAEEYSGGGVMRPPEPQVGKTEPAKPPGRRR